MPRFGETVVSSGVYKCKGLEVRWSLLFTSDIIGEARVAGMQ